MLGFMPLAADGDFFAAVTSVGVLLIIILPFILRIMTRHQREMAMLTRREQVEPQVMAEIRALKDDVRQLKDLVLDLSLNQPTRPPEVQSRIREQESSKQA